MKGNKSYFPINPNVLEDIMNTNTAIVVTAAVAVVAATIGTVALCKSSNKSIAKRLPDIRKKAEEIAKAEAEKK